MNTTNNGGPAFPADPDWLEPGTIEGSKRVAHGMSLRDYFAAKAMQAMISHRYKVFEFAEEGAADAAYEVADAMLKARER